MKSIGKTVTTTIIALALVNANDKKGPELQTPEQIKHQHMMAENHKVENAQIKTPASPPAPAAAKILPSILNTATWWPFMVYVLPWLFKIPVDF